MGLYDVPLSVSLLYSSRLSNHIYLSVAIILVYLKVGVNQCSVLSPLLFAVLMNVVPSEARSGIPSKLVYAVT